MLFFLEKIVCEFFRSANILFKKENYIPQWIENAIPKSMHLYFASIFKIVSLCRKFYRIIAVFEYTVSIPKTPNTWCMLQIHTCTYLHRGWANNVN